MTPFQLSLVLLALLVPLICSISLDSQTVLLTSTELVHDAQNLTISDVTFKPSPAQVSNHFPLVHVKKASQVTFSNVVFEGALTGSSGGALVIENSKSVSFINCTFRGNIAANGGAVFIKQSQDISFTNTLFENNKALKLQAHFTNTEFSSVSRMSLTGNDVVLFNSPQSSVTKDTGMGGAIRMESGTNVTINSCQIRQNVADEGGFISMDTYSSTAVIGSRLIANEAFTQGSLVFIGGIQPVYTKEAAENRQNLILSDSMIVDNRCHGGGRCRLVYQDQVRRLEHSAQSYPLYIISFLLGLLGTVLIAACCVLSVHRYDATEKRAPFLFRWGFHSLALGVSLEDVKNPGPFYRVRQIATAVQRVFLAIMYFSLFIITFNSVVEFLPLMDPLDVGRVWLESFITCLMSISPCLVYILAIITVYRSMPDLRVYFSEEMQPHKMKWMDVVLSILSVSGTVLCIVGCIVEAVVGAERWISVFKADTWVLEFFFRFSSYILMTWSCQLASFVVASLFVQCCLIIIKIREFFFRMEKDIHNGTFTLSKAMVGFLQLKKRVWQHNSVSGPFVAFVLILGIIAFFGSFFLSLIGPLMVTDSFVSRYNSLLLSFVIVALCMILLTVLSLIHVYSSRWTVALDRDLIRLRKYQSLNPLFKEMFGETEGQFLAQYTGDFLKLTKSEKKLQSKLSKENTSAQTAEVEMSEQQTPDGEDKEENEEKTSPNDQPLSENPVKSECDQEGSVSHTDVELAEGNEDKEIASFTPIYNNATPEQLQQTIVDLELFLFYLRSRGGEIAFNAVIFEAKLARLVAIASTLVTILVVANGFASTVQDVFYTVLTAENYASPIV